MLFQVSLNLPQRIATSRLLLVPVPRAMAPECKEGDSPCTAARHCWRWLRHPPLSITAAQS